MCCTDRVPASNSHFNKKYYLLIDSATFRGQAEWINVAHAGACEMTAREMLRCVISVSYPLIFSSLSSFFSPVC